MGYHNLTMCVTCDHCGELEEIEFPGTNGMSYTTLYNSIDLAQSDSPKWCISGTEHGLYAPFQVLADWGRVFIDTNVSPDSLEHMLCPAEYMLCPKCIEKYIRCCVVSKHQRTAYSFRLST